MTRRNRLELEKVSNQKLSEQLEIFCQNVFEREMKKFATQFDDEEKFNRFQFAEMP